MVDTLLAALAALADHKLAAPIIRTGHRWRYAHVRSIERGARRDATTRVCAIGDWLTGPRIESA